MGKLRDEKKPVLPDPGETRLYGTSLDRTFAGFGPRAEAPGAVRDSCGRERRSRARAED
jgi:hypothetical protein